MKIYKKKIFLLTVIFIIVMFFISSIQIKNISLSDNIRDNERSNNMKNLYVVREIATLNGVKEVAVLNKKNKILVGILTDNIEISTKEQTQNIVKKNFPRFSKYAISINDDLAIDIIELSYYLGAKSDRKILEKRFNFLVSKSQMQFDKR